MVRTLEFVPGVHRSIRYPDVYAALRRKGYSKAKAAAISNARGHRGGKRRRSVRRRRGRR